jgi:hypothetical protein
MTWLWKSAMSIRVSRYSFCCYYHNLCTPTGRQQDDAVIPNRDGSLVDQPWIFQHVRTLKGVVGSITDRNPLDTKFPFFSFGEAVKEYLLAHGYEASAVKEIATASLTSSTVVDFIGHLCPKGLPVKEAEYLWGLICSDVSRGG